MPIIDPNKLPKDITDKYSVVSNALRLDNVKNPKKKKINNN